MLDALRRRPRLVLVAAGVLAIVVVAGVLAAVAGGGGPRLTTDERVCQGFTPQGDLLGDDDLVDRALDTFTDPQYDDDSTLEFPDPDDRRFCVLNADTVEGSIGPVTFLTLVDADGKAFQYRRSGQREQIEWSRYVNFQRTPVVDVGNGRWLVRPGMEDTQLHVGVSGAEQVIDVGGDDLLLDLPRLTDEAGVAGAGRGREAVTPTVVLTARADGVTYAATAGGADNDPEGAFTNLSAGLLGPRFDEDVTRWPQLLAEPGVVRLVGSVLGTDASGSPAERSAPLQGIANRAVTVLARPEIADGVRALVAVQERGNYDGSREVVVAAPAEEGAGRTSVVGSIPEDAVDQAWAGGLLLPVPPTTPGAEPDPASVPHVFLALGEETTDRRDGAALRLVVDSGTERVSGRGPVVVVTPADEPRLDGRPLPAFVVTGRTEDGPVARPLDPAPGR